MGVVEGARREGRCGRGGKEGGCGIVPVSSP